MNTYNPARTDRKIAFVVSLLVATLIGCFLLFYRIFVPAVASTPALQEDPAELPQISLTGILVSNETPAAGQVKSMQQASIPSTASYTNSKEALNHSENRLFSNYKVNSYKTQTSTASNSTDELKVGATPFSGLVPGKKTGNGGTTNGVDLAGRKVLQLPKATDTKESGVVVVNIVVDKNGKVIQAEANGRGTTSSSAVLKSKACQAALEALFSPSESGENQKGSITYFFEF